VGRAAGYGLLLRLGPDAGYPSGLLPAVVVCFGLGMGIGPCRSVITVIHEAIMSGTLLGFSGRSCWR
jgi:hypothetical protein